MTNLHSDIDKTVIDIILTANSPGELSGWVTPIVHALRNKRENLRIFLFLLPCPYATGKEYQIASSLKGVDLVFRPCEYILFMLLRMFPQGIRFSKHGAILHLGGDVLHSAMLSRRLGFPAFAYVWGNKKWDKEFQEYFVPHEQQKNILINRGIPVSKITITGNLLADTIALMENDKKDNNNLLQWKNSCDNKTLLRVCFLPGSRRQEIHFIVPFFLAVAELLNEHNKNIEFVMPLSPFVDIEQLRKAIKKKPWRNFDGSRGIIERKDTGWVMKSNQGAAILVIKGHQYHAMKHSDLVVTIPGTKCGEAGYLCRPMVVILPFNKPEELPSVGLIGWLRWLPVLGQLLKKIIISMRLRNWNAYVAQPNIIAGEEIVTEIKGVITASQVANCIIDLLNNQDRLSLMHKKLFSVYHSNDYQNEGASERIIQAVFKTIDNDTTGRNHHLLSQEVLSGRSR